MYLTLLFYFGRTVRDEGRQGLRQTCSTVENPIGLDGPQREADSGPNQALASIPCRPQRAGAGALIMKARGLVMMECLEPDRHLVLLVQEVSSVAALCPQLLLGLRPEFGVGLLEAPRRYAWGLRLVRAELEQLLARPRRSLSPSLMPPGI